MLESDPSFPCFTLDGQAIVLEDYLDTRPENEGRLRALLESGRLEVGPSYVLPDELLVGAEPLVRNLLMGRAVCRRFGAEPAPVGYMPDSFGHPLQLPQILAGFGIDSFIFSRGLGDQIDEVGVVFRWRSPDGSEVRAFQQLPPYSNFNDPRCRRRPGTGRPASPSASGPRSRQRAYTSYCCATARTTAGSDATCRRCARSSRTGCPEPASRSRACATTWVRSSRTTFRRGRASCSAAGCRTCSAASTPPASTSSSANERAERRLLEVETLGALRTVHTGERFPAADFRLAWRQLLKCHPHDSICGCSCDEVHRDMLVRYEQLERTVSQLQRRALGGFDTHERHSRRDQPAPVPSTLPRRAARDGAGYGRARRFHRPPRRADPDGAPDRRRPATTAQRSRATASASRRRPMARSRCSTRRAAGASTACTGSRMSPTSATSTTSAPSKARAPGAPRRQRRGCSATARSSTSSRFEPRPTRHR